MWSSEGRAPSGPWPRLTGVLATVPERTTVIIDLVANYLDHAAHQAISDCQRRHCATSGKVKVHDGLMEPHGRVDKSSTAHRLARVARLSAPVSLAQIGGNPL